MLERTSTSRISIFRSKRVNELIRQDLPIDYYDESHILLGGAVLLYRASNLRSTGRIIGFRLPDHFIYDHFHKTAYAGRLCRRRF